VAMLPFAAGCSPGLLVGGAIVGSVLYAHANKDRLPTRREPVLHEPRTYYASPGSANRVYTASNPPVQRTEALSRHQAVTTSLIVEGARAYWEMRWEDAARILGRAIDTGAYTESELGQAHLLLGAMAYQQGDAETARRHFGQAHRHDPQLQLSPELFPPQLIDFYKDTSGP
jgi:tetratricopeptide (TPR) repeat protein